MTERRLVFAGLALFLLSATGCQPGAAPVDPQQLAQARGRFLLAEEPEGVEGVLDVQETYESPRQVVLVGQIGGVENPWSAGKASFVLADPVMLAQQADAQSDHDCTHTGCKFCAKKAATKLKEGLAVVNFVDPSGQIVPIDARQLFDLAEKQTVVVRGHAEVDGLGYLVISASGLYIRR